MNGPSLEHALGPKWRELVQFATAWGLPSGIDPAFALHHVGLNLVTTGGRWGYWATPTNSLTFATTGGDGCHFGVLLRASRPWPIVCTSPMSFDSPNLIVGESLEEFLDLGSLSGWFILDSVALKPDEASELLGPDDDAWVEKSALLEAMRARFDLKPWSDLTRRLDELNDRYLPDVELDATSD